MVHLSLTIIAILYFQLLLARQEVPANSRAPEADVFGGDEPDVFKGGAATGMNGGEPTAFRGRSVAPQLSFSPTA